MAADFEFETDAHLNLRDAKSRAEIFAVWLWPTFWRRSLRGGPTMFTALASLSSASLKLTQEPDVAGIELPDIFVVVPPHAEALNTQAEGEAGDFFGVISDRF